jgi:hypothetical protein
LDRAVANTEVLFKVWLRELLKGTPTADRPIRNGKP